MAARIWAVRRENEYMIWYSDASLASGAKGLPSRESEERNGTRKTFCVGRTDIGPHRQG
jgi:hypothetical protein